MPWSRSATARYEARRFLTATPQARPVSRWSLAKVSVSRPDRSEDLSLFILLKVDFPSGLELEVINGDFRWKLAFDSDARNLFLIRHAHGVFLACAEGGFGRVDANVSKCQMGREDRRQHGEQTMAHGLPPGNYHIVSTSAVARCIMRPCDAETC